MIHVYTSIAENYLPKALVLAESIRKFHPDWKIHLLLVQEELENVEIVEKNFDGYHLLNDLDIPNFKPWAFCHSIVELSTAIKPFLMRKLLKEENCTGVIYLDPDIALFSKLTEIEQAIKSNSIVLIPHQTEPEIDLNGIIDNEICSLRHGTYNLGFVAVSADEVAKQFAKWWSDRTYNFCRDEIPNGLFTDQKWIDLVPAIFDNVKIERSCRFNIATWNIRTRKLGGAIPDNLTVNNLQVGFYHFTGFDSGAHELMAGIYGKEQPILHQLIRWYKDKCAEVSKQLKSASPAWTFNAFEDGTVISKEMRYVYREREDLQAAFPNPFLTSNKGGFKSWWFSEGKIQYPLLFIENKKNIEIKRLKERLTPGFRNIGASSIVGLPSKTSTFFVLRRNALFLAKFPYRIIRIWLSEGMFGLLNRF